MVMKIGGLQKVSTIDYPGEISCVVFLWGCNFRCGFCHNPELVFREIEYEVSEDEFFDFLSRRVGKLDAVVISGGEPLISLDFDFVRRVKGMGFKVKVDTNGSFPERLRGLIDEGLVDYVAMDVKGAREDYSRVCGVDVDLKRIEESMRIVDGFGRGEIKQDKQDKQDEGFVQLEQNSTQIYAGEHRFFEEKSDVVIPCKIEGSATRSLSHGRLMKRKDVSSFGSEFRTTVVPGLHDLERVRRMGVWLERVLGRRAGRIFLQGFKVGGGGLIDDAFLEKGDFDEGELRRIAEGVEGLFGEVGVRC